MRWSHPTRGPLPPAEFIPLAESTGLIDPLTAVRAAAALAQAPRWLDRRARRAVAVNLSPRCLPDRDLPGHVDAAAGGARLPADLLRLEITESAVHGRPGAGHARCCRAARVSACGCRSTTSAPATRRWRYLKSLPVDELKVDRTFVMHMADATATTRSWSARAIDLGHNLGMSVVAEGVEDAAHVAALQELGCDVAQGYHYARPMPPADLTAWLRTSAATALVT